MPKQKIISLISELHETFGDDVTSDQQRQLLNKISQNVPTLGADKNDMTMIETANLLLEEISDEHPQAAATVKQIIKLLGDMGI